LGDGFAGVSVALGSPSDFDASESAFLTIDGSGIFSVASTSFSDSILSTDLINYNNQPKSYKLKTTSLEEMTPSASKTLVLASTGLL
jgi:hypothetical protein